MRESSALNEEDVLELLPWYATGKTTPAESAAIERMVNASPKLQAELAQVRRERAVQLESKKAAGEPAPEFLDRLMSQLDGARQWAPIARDASESDAPGLLARLFGFAATPAMRLAAIAACLVIVVESAALVHLAGSGGSYQTAAGPDEAAAGPRLIVRFQPDATMAAIAMLLDDSDATIVKGPMPDGACVIALKKDADVDGMITVLKGHGDLVASVDRGS